MREPWVQADELAIMSESTLSTLPALSPVVGLRARINGYGAMVDAPQDCSPDTTTDEYAKEQATVNIRKTLDYILPHVRQQNARRVLDIGCGVGTMVKTLLEQGYDAYGTDLQGLERFWSVQNLPCDRFFIVDASNTRLPFRNSSIDLAFTLGVIEHVGTSDGHANRMTDYHAIRRAWVREALRVVKVGGCLLIGGPNRNFPVDVAHGLDSCASGIEKFLSCQIGASVHRIWGENFLWGYSDLRSYLADLPCEIEAQSVAGYVGFSRVPRLLRGLVEGYIDHLPRFFLATGFNPWMMALVRKTAAFPEEEK